MGAQYYSGIAYGIWFDIRDVSYFRRGQGDTPPRSIPEALVTVFIRSGIAKESLSTADTEHDLFTSVGIIAFAREVNRHISDDLNLRLHVRGEINGGDNTLRYLAFSDPFTERVITGSDVRTITGVMEPLDVFVDVFNRASVVLDELDIPHAGPGHFLWSEIVHEEGEPSPPLL